MATTRGAFDVQVVAQTYLGVAYHNVGDFRQALDASRRAMALLSGELRHARFGQVSQPTVLSHVRGAYCLGELGDFAEGHGVGAEAMRLAEAIEQPYSIASVLLWVGGLYRRQGDIHQAIPRLERGLALCQNAHIPLFFPLTAASLGAAYALAGRTAEALPLLDQALERSVTGSRMLARALVLAELSEALLLVGRMDEASALAGRLFEICRTHTGRGYQAHAGRLLGDVAMRREPPDVDQAVAHYHQALADELGMRPLQAHCHRGFGMLYASTGQQEQARTELSAAIALYRDMAMTFWLPQAEAALAQVEAR